MWYLEGKYFILPISRTPGSEDGRFAIMKCLQIEGRTNALSLKFWKLGLRRSWSVQICSQIMSHLGPFCENFIFCNFKMHCKPYWCKACACQLRTGRSHWISLKCRSIARAIPDGQSVTYPENQNEEENEETVRKNLRN